MKVKNNQTKHVKRIHLEPLSEERPWGRYRVLLREEQNGFQVKRIEVKPGGRLSLQKHAHRSEIWTITQGRGIAQVGAREIPVKPGNGVHIARGEVHRISNPHLKPLIFVEVQIGDVLSESDIERLEDDYKRI